MILARVGNQKTTINKTVRAIERIFVFDPVKYTINTSFGKTMGKVWVFWEIFE